MRGNPTTFELDPVVWKHDIPGTSIDITTPVLANAEPGTTKYDVMLVTGYGEGEWTARRGLDCLRKIGVNAITPLLSVDNIPAEEIHLTSFVSNAVPQVADVLLRDGHTGGQLPAIGHSLGGLYVALGARSAPELIGSIGLNEPVGQNNRELVEMHPDEKERYHKFVARFAKVVRGPYWVSPLVLARAGLEIFSQIAIDLRDRPYSHRFRTKLSLASGVEATSHVLEHARAGNRVFILLGAKDPLIKPHEVRASIHRHRLQEWEFYKEQPEERLEEHKNLEVRVTRQPHSHISMRQGQNHLRITAQGIGLVDNGVIHPTEHYTKLSEPYLI